MAEASQKVVAAHEKVSPRSASPPSDLGYSSGSEKKHRESLANLHMISSTTMEPEEKDKFIEKLKRRDRYARAKIQKLENANADFYKTIQTQQDLLESMEKKLEDQEKQLREEKHNLRLKKNASLRKLKHLLDKEKAKDGQLSPRSDYGEKSKRDALRLENTRLQQEVQRLSEVFSGSPRIENYPLTDHTMEIQHAKIGARVHKSIQRQGIWLIILFTAIVACIVTAAVLHDAIPNRHSAESSVDQLSSLEGPQ